MCDTSFVIRNVCLVDYGESQVTELSRKKKQRRAISPDMAKSSLLTTSTEISPTSLTLSLVLLFLLKRHVVSSNLPFAALLVAWYLFNKRNEVLFSLVSVSNAWPPCNFDQPKLAIRIPLPLRFLDLFPSFSCSFGGVPNAEPMYIDAKKKLAAWRITCTQEDEPTVLYFKSPFSHRGQYLRTCFYAMLSSLSFNTVTFDRTTQFGTELTERALLKDAHAMWSATAKQCPTHEMVCWGSSVLGSYSAATLCLYLMRRGTPPACLVLENPLIRMPGATGTYTCEMFNLEDRIRAICSFEDCRNVPIFFVCAENELFAPPVEDCQRLASVASALSASQRIVHCTLPCTMLEMYSDARFKLAVSTFISIAVRDASVNDGGRSKRRRGFSTDFTIESNNSFEDSSILY